MYFTGFRPTLLDAMKVKAITATVPVRPRRCVHGLRGAPKYWAMNSIDSRTKYKAIITSIVVSMKIYPIVFRRIAKVGRYPGENY